MVSLIDEDEGSPTSPEDGDGLHVELESVERVNFGRLRQEESQTW